MKGKWIEEKPKIHVRCSNCNEYAWGWYDYCPFCGSHNLNNENVIKCNYCKNIDKATPNSPRKKYKLCPMCGRYRI